MPKEQQIQHSLTGAKDMTEFKTDLTPIYIDHMGNDMRSCNMARQSFGKWKAEDQELTEQDKGLIRFLAEGIKAKDKAVILDQMKTTTDPAILEALAKSLFPQRHWVPLAHNQISIHMEAPIPIRTQCFKHKVGGLESEESRRYIFSRPIVFLPDYFAGAAADVKQGSTGLPHDRSDYWLSRYRGATRLAVQTYMDMVQDGIAPEEARFVLPQGVIVKWGWTGSLVFFASFFNQRTDPHAQRQIRDLANKAGEIIAPLYPYSWQALTGQAPSR